MASGKPDFRWPAKIRTSIAFCLVGAVAGTGLYVGNLAFLASQREGEPLADPLVIGVSADLPGWELTQEGQHTGFALDLANWLADDLHYTPKFINVSPPERMEKLINGQVQLILDSYSITDSRKEELSFAGPFMLTQQGLMTKADGVQIHTLADVSDKVVCASDGAASADQLMRRNVTVTIEADLPSCVRRMQDGRVDAVSADQILLFGIARHYNGLRVSNVTFGSRQRYGIALKHGNIDACNVILDRIRKFITSDAWDRTFQTNMPNVRAAEHKPDPNDLDQCE